MLSGFKTSLRRWLRGAERGRHFPIRLPHHAVVEGRLATLNQPARAIEPALARALVLCDGSRTLADVARQASISRPALIAAQDDGLILLWRSPVPPEAPRLEHQPQAIILSPHLDDAALCCGGRILMGHQSLVINIFSRGAWWRLPFGQDDAVAIQACRRAEESLVARLAGVAMLDLELPEAMLRGHSFDEVFTRPPDDRDRAATAAVLDRLAELARDHPLAHWYFPAGVGGHLDHRIVRDAALEALPRAGIKPSHLHLYEDQPYAAEGKTSDLAQSHPQLKLTPDLLDIEDVIQWKLELLRAYWSQLTWSQIALLKKHARSAGEGETVEVSWRLA